MNWNSAIPQLHRLLSITFVTGVGIYVVTMQKGRRPGWIGVFPLLPLLSFMGTGLYMFVLL